jgi:Na+-driven multidrug efflux pump
LLMGNQILKVLCGLPLGTSSMSSIIFDLWIWFSWNGIVGAAIGTIVLVVMLVLCIISWSKFHPYFENFSLKRKNVK